MVARGARVIIACRDEQRAKAAAKVQCKASTSYVTLPLDTQMTQTCLFSSLCLDLAAAHAMESAPQRFCMKALR